MNAVVENATLAEVPLGRRIYHAPSMDCLIRQGVCRCGPSVTKGRFSGGIRSKTGRASYYCTTGGKRKKWFSGGVSYYLKGDEKTRRFPRRHEGGGERGTLPLRFAIASTGGWGGRTSFGVGCRCISARNAQQKGTKRRDRRPIGGRPWDWATLGRGVGNAERN